MNAPGRQRLRYMISDYLALNVGWFLFTLLRYSFLAPLDRLHYSLSAHLTSAPVLGGQILIPLVMLGVYWLSGYYNNVFFKSRLEELVNTISVSFVGAIIIFFVVLINDKVNERMFNYELVILLGIFLFVPVYVVRFAITRSAIRRIRRREIVFNTLIVGSGQNAVNLARELDASTRARGFNIVGLVNTGVVQREDNASEYRVYKFDDLGEVIGREKVTRLIVVPQHNGIRETGELINGLFVHDCDIYVTTELYGVMVMRPHVSDIAGEPLIDISRVNTSAMTVNCKRASDVLVSAMTLIVLSPFLLGLAIAVKCSGRGPVIYRQERIGYHKKPFNILKFRTMVCDAEAEGPALSSLNDPRITRVGHFLRKYRLDELPQFWNVLKGDMSLVGPRPERDFYIRQIVARAPYYSLVHQVRPGITSWGMVKFGYATSVDQMISRLRYDLIYIENVSLPVDLKILFYTVNTVLTGKGL